jgi:uncharacterized protein (DUF488 family)
MYYRRKLILGILEEFGGKLNHTNFQKILFLVTRNQEKKAFDFVPYKFGCFSFQANQDLLTLGKYGLVNSETNSKSSNWILSEDSNFHSELKKEDQSSIKKVKRKVEQFSQKELVKHTYLNYPFYATKSQIAKDILSDVELNTVKKQKRNIEGQEFFTIGYEGVSLETYLNKLIINDVKLLCDVRKNSLSMKYGFSKSQLKNACESIGIKYLHIPQLGIESDKRKKLVTMSDYNQLFEEYEKTTLIDNQDSIKELFQLVHKYKRVAITCFEKEVCMCHRGRVLNSLTSLPEWSIPYKNL